jgi:hypothetical protein
MWGNPTTSPPPNIFERIKQKLENFVGHIPLVKGIELFLSGVKEERPTNRICMFVYFILLV